MERPPRESRVGRVFMPPFACLIILETSVWKPQLDAPVRGYQTQQCRI
jgi:hypothetical protein